MYALPKSCTVKRIGSVRRSEMETDRSVAGGCPPCLALRLVCTGVRTNDVVRI